MKRRILLGTILVVFLVSLFGMSAQAFPLKTKEIEVKGYKRSILKTVEGEKTLVSTGPQFIGTVTYPDFKRVKKFSIGEKFRIDLVLVFDVWSYSFEEFCKNKIAFTIQAFQGKKWPTLEDLKQLSMFCPTEIEVCRDRGVVEEIRVRGYIEIVVNREKADRIVEAIKGYYPLRLIIWQERYWSWGNSFYRKKRLCATTVELD